MRNRDGFIQFEFPRERIIPVRETVDGLGIALRLVAVVLLACASGEVAKFLL